MRSIDLLKNVYLKNINEYLRYMFIYFKYNFKLFL